MWTPPTFSLLRWTASGQCVCFTPGIQLLLLRGFYCLFLGVVYFWVVFMLWFKGHYHLYVTTLWIGCFALGFEVSVGLLAYCPASQLYCVWWCAINLYFSYLWLFVSLFDVWCWLSSLAFVPALASVWRRVRDYKEFSLWSKTSFWKHYNGILPLMFIWSLVSPSMRFLLPDVLFLDICILLFSLLLLLFLPCKLVIG